jgi:peptidyl-tRNA hydrolase
MKLGNLCAQLAHAAGQSGSGHYCIILAAKSESHLLKIENQLKINNIEHAAIREPDPPFNGSITAIGLFPIHDRKSVSQITKKLRLLKELDNGI